MATQVRHRAAGLAQTEPAFNPTGIGRKLVSQFARLRIDREALRPLFDRGIIPGRGRTVGG